MAYIGIDIGDGESAVTTVSADGAIMPRVLPLGHVRSILSVVGRLNGQVIVGDGALLDPAVTDRRARFKSRFLFEPEAEEGVRMFAQGLYRLLKEGTVALNQADLNVTLGCPAGWTAQDRNRYAGVVMSAGFPNLSVVSESRAAFLYARHSKELNLSPEMLSRPALVIDIGSSTTDFAYIVDGRETNVGVFGEVSLGGGVLDASILEDAVSSSPDRDALTRLLDADASWRSYCELDARKLKEDYFSNEQLWAAAPCTRTTPIYADVNAPMSLHISVDGAKMERILRAPAAALQGQSFVEALNTALMNAKAVTADAPPELLILTGGASRMRFFREACREAFPDADIAICDEPEFSIARGLGIAARTDHQLAKFRAELTAIFNEGLIQSEINKNLSSLLTRLSPAIVEVVIEHGLSPVFAQIAQGAFSDREEVGRAVQEGVNLALKNSLHMQGVNRLIDEWVAASLTGVQRRIDAACDTYQIARADMSLVQLHARAQINGLKMPWLIRFLLNRRGMVANQFMGAISAFLMGVSIGTQAAKKQLTKQMTATLSNTDGEFARQLSAELRDELTKQLEARMKTVEIQIS